MEGLSAYLKPELIWFLVGFAMLIVEFAAPGIFFVFFAIGAWITAIACLAFDLNLTAQLLIFLFSSVLSLLLLRRKFQRVFTGTAISTEEMPSDEFIGKKAVVKQTITPGRPGKVELHGSTWTAEADEPIEENEYVVVSGRDGLVLQVTKQQKEQI
ncbi:MAG TPA: NfeD family protein [Deltaproteobacteria bacterium]|nr:NfeD family protein [Deltaproteobacteria bacterium]